MEYFNFGTNLPDWDEKSIRIEGINKIVEAEIIFLGEALI
jgi:hypothetical protein